MSSQDESSDPVLVQYDTIGRQVDIYPGLQPPFFFGVAVPDNKVMRDDDFCTPCTLVQEQANNANLALSVIYMAQSEAGRRAIATLSDRNIVIGYADQFEKDGLLQAGYKGGKAYVLLQPGPSPNAQHLILLQQAAQFEAAVTLSTSAHAEPSLDVKTMMAHAIQVAGLVAIADHGEECLANRAADPERFVPPNLELGLTLISLMQISTGFEIPANRQARAAYAQEMVDAAQMVLDPLSALRNVTGVKSHKRGYKAPSLD